MEAPEVPTEHLHEEMHHRSMHSGEKWVLGVALSSALLAGLAAVTSLLAGHHANEAMVDQIRAANQWSYFQSKSIKENLLVTKREILEGMGRETDGRDRAKLEEYRKDKEDIQRQAREKETRAEHHLHNHVIFARGVTLFQVSIAVGAISVLTQRRRFWLISLLFGLAGAWFLAQGLVYSSREPAVEMHAPETVGKSGH